MPTSRVADVAVVFIHGLAKKPHPDKLTELWLWGLGRDNPQPDVFAPPNAGIALGTLGIPHHFNYYADVFYGTDYETDLDGYYEASIAELETEGLHALEASLDMPKPVTPREAEFLIAFERHLAATPSLNPDDSAARAIDKEVAALIPGAIRQAIIKKAAMEAYYFLFNKEYHRADGARFNVREELRRRLVEQLVKAHRAATRLIVVSHSMGTMVAYDVLRNCSDAPPVDTLITLGSPLGVREVQAELKAIDSARVDFPDRVGRWINIYDPLDPICGADPCFANDYTPVNGKAVVDVKESNWGSWRHSITHYLSGTRFRAHLNDALKRGAQ